MINQLNKTKEAHRAPRETPISDRAVSDRATRSGADASAARQTFSRRL